MIQGPCPFKFQTLYKMHKICIYKNSIKNTQRDINLKQCSRKQPLLYGTHCPDLNHIPMKLLEDIPNGYSMYKNVWKK